MIRLAGETGTIAGVTMEPKEIRIDDVTVTIKAMDDSYVIGDDPEEAGIEYKIKCWPGKPVEGSWPNPSVAAYYRKLIDAYGSGAIMAWRNRSLLGFLPFYPYNCGLQRIHCVCAPVSSTVADIDHRRLIPFDALNPKILELECLSVDPGLYRKGLGTAMSCYLIEWAKAQGWEHIRGWAFADTDFIDAYRWGFLKNT